MGIIGFDLLKHFTLAFDYDLKELTLISGGSDVIRQSPPDKIINFKMIGHIPVINAIIADQPVELGIDCGAGGAMLFKNLEDPLRENYTLIGQDVLTGADQESQIGNVVMLDCFNVGGIDYKNHKFLFISVFPQ